MAVRCHPFRASDDGNAIVEFAMLAPALFLFLLGIFEVAILLFVGGTLESAVLAAARFGTTGADGGGISREERIREIIADRTLGFVPMNEAQITARVYPSFADIGAPEPFTDSNRNGRRDSGEPYSDVNGNGQWDADMGRAGLGGPGDIVLYEVEYETRGITSLMRPILGPITHRATVAVRNEPF